MTTDLILSTDGNIFAVSRREICHETGLCFSTTGRIYLLPAGVSKKFYTAAEIPADYQKNICKINDLDFMLTIERSRYIIGFSYKHQPKWNGSTFCVFLENEADFMQAKLGL